MKVRKPWMTLGVAAIVIAIGLPVVYRNRTVADPPGEAPATGVTTADVQAFDQFWRSVWNLHRREPDTNEAEFKRRVVRETTAYLGIDSTDGFATVADTALEELRRAKKRINAIEPTSAGEAESDAALLDRRRRWREWQDAQQAAADRLLIILQPKSRHQLFTEKRLLWLLRLAYGIDRFSKPTAKPLAERLADQESTK